MKNPFQLISELGSGKAEKVIGSTFKKLSQFNKIAEKEQKQLATAVKHNATIVSHRKELAKINKRLSQQDLSDDKRKELNIRKGFLNMDMGRRQKYFAASPMRRRASIISTLSNMAGIPVTPGNAQAVAQGTAASSGGAAGSGGRGGRGGRGGPPSASGYLQMMGNFLGGEFYYFAKGINQAGKNTLAFGVALYAGMKTFNLLRNMVNRVITSFREMVTISDEVNMMTRRTRIASGSYGAANRDIRHFRGMQMRGEVFASDEDYVTARRNFMSLGEDYREGLSMMQKLSFATGETIGTLSNQYYDAIQFGGDALYKTLGKNNRLMQHVMSVFPEGTVTAREAVQRLLKDQELLNSVMSDTPRTIGEMKQQIKGFKDLMIMNLVGDPTDSTSLYSVYRDTFKSISEWLNDHQEEFTQLANYTSRIFKSMIRSASGFVSYMTKRATDYLNQFIVTADEMPDRMLAFEFYLARLEGKIEKFYRNTVPKLNDFFASVWAGLAPFRWLGNAILFVTRQAANLVDFLAGTSLGDSDLFKSSAGLFVMLFSLIRVGKIVRGVFKGIGLVFKATSKVFAKFLLPFISETYSLAKAISAVTLSLLGLSKFAASGGIMGKILTSIFGSGKTMTLFLKRLPVIGFLFSFVDAMRRFYKGDTAGGFIALAAGLASFIPGFGTAASIGLDAYNFSRDPFSKKEEKESTSFKSPSPSAPYDGTDLFARRAWANKHENQPYHPNITNAPNINIEVNNMGGALSPEELRDSVFGAAKEAVTDTLVGATNRGGRRINDQTR